MRITSRQLRQIIREELIREARNPLVKQLQAEMGMSASEQDGIWGPNTDIAFAAAIEKYVGRVRDLKDSLGNVIDPASIAPNWMTIAPILSGGIIGKSGSGRRIPTLTGDTQGALTFIKFLKNDITKPSANWPRTQWRPRFDNWNNIKTYEDFYYDSWPKWSYEDKANKQWVYDVTPADLLAQYDNFTADIISSGYANIGGNSGAIPSPETDSQGNVSTPTYYSYFINDLDTLDEFFKKQ